MIKEKCVEKRIKGERCSPCICAGKGEKTLQWDEAMPNHSERDFNATPSAALRNKFRQCFQMGRKTSQQGWALLTFMTGSQRDHSLCLHARLASVHA